MKLLIAAAAMALVFAGFSLPESLGADYGGDAGYGTRRDFLRGDYLTPRYWAQRNYPRNGYRLPRGYLPEGTKIIGNVAFVPTSFYRTKDGRTIAYNYRPVFYGRQIQSSDPVYVRGGIGPSSDATPFDRSSPSYRLALPAMSPEAAIALERSSLDSPGQFAGRTLLLTPIASGPAETSVRRAR